MTKRAFSHAKEFLGHIYLNYYNIAHAAEKGHPQTSLRSLRVPVRYDGSRQSARTASRTATPACHNSPRILTSQKYQCFVLWRNRVMPASPPTAPPQNETPSSTLSGIRRAPRFALDLSAPYIARLTTLITAYTIRTYKSLSISVFYNISLAPSTYTASLLTIALKTYRGA